MAKPNNDIQLKGISLVKDFMHDAKRLSESRRSKLIDIYEEFVTFTQDKGAEWATSFKVNKAHQVIETILPRLVAKDPRWVVTPREMDLDSEWTKGIQDYLTYLFDEYGLIEPIRLWAKNMLIYGNSYAKVKFKYEVVSVMKEEGRAESLIKPEGAELPETPEAAPEKMTAGRLAEEVIGEYPTIDVISWTDIYIDPRYVMMADMPAVCSQQNGVRLSHLMKDKKLFNLDKVKELGGLHSFKNDQEGYKNQVFNITGIDNITPDTAVDLKALTVTKYYGYFNETENVKDEKMYEMWLVDDLVMIYFDEITQLPFVDIKAFEDTETHYATGFVEPIMGLQQEMNFKKNSASEYINHSLNRSWLWSPNSGVDPKDLISKPNNIIPVTGSVAEAQQNLQELPHRTITADYFQEQNDIERQIQSMTFTVDTANPRSQQAMTNTATGIRVKFFESNSVINEIRKHFEQALERLAYKLLQVTFDNMEDNIVIKKMGKEGYWNINKELLRNAIQRYSIKVEVASSSYNDLEDRRDEAIAFYNMLQGAFNLGIVTEDGLREGLKEIISTFEKKNPNKFLGEKKIPEVIEQGQPKGAGEPAEMPPPRPSEASEMTEQVAKGSITTAV